MIKALRNDSKRCITFANFTSESVFISVHRNDNNMKNRSATRKLGSAEADN